jgi:hypothetical protein
MNVKKKDSFFRSLVRETDVRKGKHQTPDTLIAIPARWPLPSRHAPLKSRRLREVGIFSIDPVALIAGSLPRRQRRLVEA